MLIDFIVDYRLHSISVYVFRERPFRIVGYAASGRFGISTIVTFTVRFRLKLTNCKCWVRQGYPGKTHY